MAESWHLRNTAGAACGPGDREALSQSVGGVNATKVLDGTGDTWNRTESARTLGAGNWQVVIDYDCSSGGGPPNEITVLVERRNSSCVVQQTIINEVVEVTKGATAATVSTPNVNPGAVTFAAGDILTVTLTQTRGNQTITLRYNGTLNFTSDSQLNHPSPDGFLDASWMEIEVADPNAQGQVSFAEFEVPNANEQGQVSFAEFETPDVAGRGQVSFTEFETPDVAGRGQVSFTELEVPDLDAQGQLSFAEFEVPNPDAQGQLSFAEFEVPNPDAKGQVSFAEFEVPNPDAKGQVSFTEFEVPDLDAQGQLSFAEFEVPTPDSQGQVSFAEFEVPTPDAQGQLSFTEFEVPNPDAQGQVSFAEFEVPTPDAQGQVSFAEFEVPTPDAQGQISFAEFETPDAGNRGQVSFTEFEVPNPDAQGQVSFTEFEVPDVGGVQGRSQVSFTEFEVPDIADPAQAQTSFAFLETPDVAPNAQGQVSQAEFITPNVNVGGTQGAANLSFGEFEIPDAIAIVMTRMSLEIPEARRRGRVSQAHVGFPSVARISQHIEIVTKNINRDLLLEELDVYGVLPALLSLPGFTSDADQRVWTPNTETIVIDGDIIQSGEMRLNYNFVLDSEKIKLIKFVIARHNATGTTTEQDIVDQDATDLARMSELQAKCPILTPEEQSEAICLLLRMMLRFHTNAQI